MPVLQTQNYVYTCKGAELCGAFADCMTLARMPADALAGLGAYLLAPDRAVQHLLHALPWRPVLLQLAPLASPGMCNRGYVR